MKGRNQTVLKTRANRLLQITVWLLSFIWLVFLVWMSSQDGEATANTSMRLANFIVRLFGIPVTKASEVDQLLRTLAHFIGFFILGCLVHISARLTWPDQRHGAILIVALCSAIAVLDEVKKVFITGRHLSWSEAGLNIVGVFCGVILSLGIQWFTARRKTRRAS